MAQGCAVDLCAALSGFDDLSERFAAAAVQRVSSELGADIADRLEAVFKADGLKGLAAEPDLTAATQLLLTFLYTGFTDAMPTSAAIPENHFESLMWRAVDAHPPGLSGGYFGHWHYPPEDRV